MALSADLIKELREETGAGISDIKRALEDAGGDPVRAREFIERRLGNIAEKKASRETKAGVVDAYIHSNGRIGALVEVFCETDFVARNPAFKEFAHDIALHIAAMSPLYLSSDAVPQEVWQAERLKVTEEVKKLGKPEGITSEIIDGKLKSHFGSFSLMSQPFVKDQDKTVEEFLKESIGRFGENIRIGRFTRFEF